MDKIDKTRIGQQYTVCERSFNTAQTLSYNVFWKFTKWFTFVCLIFSSYSASANMHH